jgi:hypothetical protein
MWSIIVNYVNDRAFELTVVGSVIVILLIGIYKWIYGGENSGSYTTKKYWELLPIKEVEVYNPSAADMLPASDLDTGNGDSKGEVECRRVLEELFKKPFPKSRPNFLNNPVTGGKYNLELDCANHELKIACEYNGIQHYKYTPYFHKNKEQFQLQQYRDDMKRRICKEQGYTLVEVPYTTKITDIDNFIKTELSKTNRI